MLASACFNKVAACEGCSCSAVCAGTILLDLYINIILTNVNSYRPANIGACPIQLHELPWELTVEHQTRPLECGGLNPRVSFRGSPPPPPPWEMRRV